MSESTAVILGSLAFSFVLVLVIHIWQNREDIAKLGPLHGVPYQPPTDVYLGLRNLVLHGSREKFDLPYVSSPAEPWAVMMDWGVRTGIATVVAFSNGNASIYTSTGGGSIGGGQSHPMIQSAAKNAVFVAAELAPRMQAATSEPLPRRGEVMFYVCADAGVRTATAAEKEVRKGRHPLSKLGDAMQAVVTQYRLLSPP